MATMRKLKLQVQMTVGGFAAGPEGQLDWMTRNLDEGVLVCIVQITDSSDTILLGRKMTDGFIKYWEAVKPESPEYIFARKMVDTPKVVFSKTLTRVEGKNVRVETDRKSTRLNSSHVRISYAVFCLKKKKTKKKTTYHTSCATIRT